VTSSMIEANLALIRAEFPALARMHGDLPYSYLDGPGGTQVPRRAIVAMTNYLERCNANHEGAFPTSRESDATLAEAHAAAADYLGAADASEVVFGQNMTTLTFAVSRAIGRSLKPGDEIVVTRLDHDANVAPWLALQEERGIVIRWVGIRDSDCTLDLHEMERVLGPRTRIVAVGLASNAVGTINPIPRIGDGACRRRSNVRGCRARGAARTDRRGRDGYGLPRLLAIQVLRAASWPALRKARTPRGARVLQGPSRRG
jgi:selenocysteine lyase/cysteine desulfurase